MTESEQRMVRAILIAARVDAADLDWMVASCPSVDRARELYPRGVTASPRITLPPHEAYDGIWTAREACIAARASGDSDEFNAAMELLRVAIDAFTQSHLETK